MFGKRMSNTGKGRSSIKNESNSPSHKTNSSTTSSVNKHSKSTGDERKTFLEINVGLPMIETQDNATKLPTYTSVLARPATNATVLDEELDLLQPELETLLSTLACRTNIIYSEIDADDYKLKDHNKRLKLNVKQAQFSGNRRKNIEKSLPHKGAKMGNNLFKSKNLKRVGVSGSGSLSRSSGSSISETTSELSKPTVTKNDTAFKFWASVEPYCAQLGSADLVRLVKLISKYEEPLPAIPDLGPHYSQRWTAEDLLMEQNFSSSEKIQSQNMDMNLNIPAHIATMLKKTEGCNGDIPGPLTQRLLSALLNVPEIDDIDQKLNSNSERILRKELITLGIMDEDDFPKPNPNDEVWEEIKRVYSDLTALNKQNVQKLKELHSAAQIEVKKTSFRRKLDEMDNQILETLMRFQSAKQEKRQISDKEFHDAEKLLREQIYLNEKIISMPSSGPHWM